MTQPASPTSPPPTVIREATSNWWRPATRASHHISGAAKQGPTARDREGACVLLDVRDGFAEVAPGEPLGDGWAGWHLEATPGARVVVTQRSADENAFTMPVVQGKIFTPDGPVDMPPDELFARLHALEQQPHVLQDLGIRRNVQSTRAILGIAMAYYEKMRLTASVAQAPAPAPLTSAPLPTASLPQMPSPAAPSPMSTPTPSRAAVDAVDDPAVTPSTRGTAEPTVVDSTSPVGRTEATAIASAVAKAAAVTLHAKALAQQDAASQGAPHVAPDLAPQSTPETAPQAEPPVASHRPSQARLAIEAVSVAPEPADTARADTARADTARAAHAASAPAPSVAAATPAKRKPGALKAPSVPEPSASAAQPGMEPYPWDRLGLEHAPRPTEFPNGPEAASPAPAPAAPSPPAAAPTETLPAAATDLARDERPSPSRTAAPIAGRPWQELAATCPEPSQDILGHPMTLLAGIARVTDAREQTSLGLDTLRSAMQMARGLHHHQRLQTILRSRPSLRERLRTVSLITLREGGRKPNRFATAPDPATGDLRVVHADGMATGLAAESTPERQHAARHAWAQRSTTPPTAGLHAALDTTTAAIAAEIGAFGVRTPRVAPDASPNPATPPTGPHL